MPYKVIEIFQRPDPTIPWPWATHPLSLIEQPEPHLLPGFISENILILNGGKRVEFTQIWDSKDSYSTFVLMWNLAFSSCNLTINDIDNYLVENGMSKSHVEEEMQ